MRDQKMTGYAPRLTPGITPEQLVTVHERSVACDGDIAGPGLGHPRIWMRIEAQSVTCPYCSITYVLEDGAGVGNAH